VSDLYAFDDEPAPPTQIRTRAAPDDRAGRPTARRGVARGGRDNAQAVIIGVALGGLFLICAALGPKYVLVLAAVVAYVWAARSGQFDDTDTPAIRPLIEDDDTPPK